MKRSATPLHSGSPTYDGEIVHPSHFTSLSQASATCCGPPGHVLGEGPEGMADTLGNGFEGCPPIAQLGRVPADDLVQVVIDGAEEPAPAVGLGVAAGRVGPHITP